MVGEVYLRNLSCSDIFKGLKSRLFRLFNIYERDGWCSMQRILLLCLDRENMMVDNIINWTFSLTGGGGERMER